MAKPGAQHRLLEALLHKDPNFKKPSGLLSPPKALTPNKSLAGLPKVKKLG
jgi:hypothetical protein